ncbi:hypothetical protein [Rhizobium oryzicola]|uniref:Uncharacterized protein n=1 Tax=Rhizobium oryzicola TaxID=1232668 RepID=A0ABT8SWI5_9HYPH|nr:hypothetical protein [Rhizobium oryzicola]MDO1582393.1 hypothetical protein [Rhizobium oryzicola]
MGDDGEQFVRDAIRSAYDRGYNGARNAKSVPGDSALGYRGRDMSEEIAVDVLARLHRLPSPSSHVSVPKGWKLVPEIPTEEMECAPDHEDCATPDAARATYLAMLAKVPPSPLDIVTVEVIPSPQTHVDVEDISEQKLATIVAPDNGSPHEVLSYVLECAKACVPEARIIGNARAGDIARAIEAIPAPQSHVGGYSSRLTLFSMLFRRLTKASTRLSDLTSSHIAQAQKAMTNELATRKNQSAPVGPNTATSSAERGFELTSLIKTSPTEKITIRHARIAFVFKNLLTMLTSPLTAASKRVSPETILNHDSGSFKNRKKANAGCNLAGMHHLLAHPAPQPTIKDGSTP